VFSDPSPFGRGPDEPLDRRAASHASRPAAMIISGLYAAGSARTRRSPAGLAFLQGGRMTPLLVGFVAAWLCSTTALAQTLDRKLWGTGNVNAIARCGNTLYFAGALGEAGPNTGGWVPLGAETGAPISPYPRVAGSVSSAVPDGQGGWFIAGNFAAVDGLPREGCVPRKSLARVGVERGDAHSWLSTNLQSPRLSSTMSKGAVWRHRFGTLCCSPGNTMFRCGWARCDRDSTSTDSKPGA
jgi:hypothetical protein